MTVCDRAMPGRSACPASPRSAAARTLLSRWEKVMRRRDRLARVTIAWMHGSARFSLRYDGLRQLAGSTRRESRVMRADRLWDLGAAYGSDLGFILRFRLGQ